MVEEPKVAYAVADVKHNRTLGPDLGTRDSIDVIVPEEGEIVGEDASLSSNEACAAGKPHPLEHKWTLWFDNPAAKSKQITWGSSIRSIYTFATVEEFWGIINNMHAPSKLAVGADLYCFKHYIEPKWEDPVCAHGGRWTLTFSKEKSDTPWLHTLLAMIGEQFEHGDEICGAVINVRKIHDKIALWTKNAFMEAVQLNIGKQWKEFLDLKETTGYIFNEDSAKLDRGAKNRYST